MEKVNGGFPVQETRKKTSSEMDSGHFPKTHLSKEETPHISLNHGPKPQIYKENTKTSAETCKCEHVTTNKTQEGSIGFSLDGNGSSESGHKGDVTGKPNDNILAHLGENASNDRIDNIDIYTSTPSGELQGEANTDKSNTRDLENKTSTDPGRNNDDFSCFRPTSEETDVKVDNGKVFGGTRPNDNSSTGLEQESIAKEVLKPGNHPTMTLTSEDSATAGYEEDNLTLESHRSNNSATKVIDLGHNGDVGCKNNSEKFAHHEVNISFSGVSQTGGNASNLDKDNPIVSEIKTSTDPGRDNNFSCHESNIKETDVKEGKSKTFNGTCLNDNSSTGLQQDVPEVTRTYDDAAMIVKSEDSSTTGFEENLTPDGDRSSNHATKVFELEPNGDERCRHNGEILACHDTSFSEANQTGEDASTFRIYGGTNTDAYTTTTSCKLQGGANVDQNNAIGQEINIPRNNGRGNNDLSYCRQTISESDAKKDNFSAGPLQDATEVINLSPNIFKINDDTKREAHIKGRRKDQSLKGRDNNGLSHHRPKSQHQSCDSLATANPTDVLHGTGSVITTIDDHVSMSCRSDITFPSETKMDRRSRSKRSSRRYNPWNIRKGLWNALEILLTLYIFWVIMVPIASARPAQAFPVTLQWRSFTFCAENGSIIGQVLTIRNMDDRSAKDCTVSFTRARLYYNCSQSENLLFGINGKCVEMLTEDMNTTNYNMEYKDTPNGNNKGGHVPGIPGEQLSGAGVMAKIAEYTTTPPPLNGGNTTTSLQQERSRVGIILGVLGFVVCFAILFVVLYKNWLKFKRFVNYRERETNRASNTDNNQEDAPLNDIPNGRMNGRVPNEESKQQN